MLSHAAIFWDDEMEQGNSNFSTSYMLSTMIPGGNMAYDTNVKLSGSGSIRLNYTPNCQVDGTSNQCGGSLTKTFPRTDNVWKRVYFRMSGSGPNPGPNGQFETSTTAFTKLLKGQSVTIGGLYARHWWMLGCCKSKNLIQTMENVPKLQSSTNLTSSITLADNRWYCIETHEVMNTPGVANGISEAWVDNVKVAANTNVMWRHSGMGTDIKWSEFSIFRQNGIGNIWFDRFAAGDTRIGCIGSIPQGDTTPPQITSGVSVR